MLTYRTYWIAGALAFCASAAMAQERSTRFEEPVTAIGEFSRSAPAKPDTGARAFTTRAIAAGAGGLALAFPAYWIWREGASLTSGGYNVAAAYVVGSALGATLAAERATTGTFAGAVLGAALGAVPLLFLAAESDHGETGAAPYGVPVAAITIPVGSALGSGR